MNASGFEVITTQAANLHAPTRRIAAWLLLIVALPAWSCTPSQQAPRPLSIVVSGDTAGWIRPCGCTTKQAGGLLRRGTFVADLQQQHDVLVADAGGAAGGTSRYDVLKFTALCRGEVAMGVAAHNLGQSELALGAEPLRQIAAETRIPFLSTNVRTVDGQVVATERMEIRIGTHRIGILGVIAPQFATQEFKIADPREAILQHTAGMRKHCDTILVLAYLPEEQLEALAATIPDVDLLIGGPTRQSIAPRKSGRTTWAAATAKGKFLVRLDSRPDSALTERWSGDLVEMGESLPDHSQQQANLRQFYDELAALDLPADATGFATRLPANIPAGFRIAGSDQCRQCHPKDCLAWEASSHARAWQTLVEKESTVDPYCQQCHSTGYGLPGGFVSLLKSRDRVDVGCESCHGPAASHVKQPQTHTPYDARDRCLHCHDSENSPRFKLTEFWEQIEHGQSADSP